MKHARVFLLAALVAPSTASAQVVFEADAQRKSVVDANYTYHMATGMLSATSTGVQTPLVNSQVIYNNICPSHRSRRR